jgi:hypothetical protein
MTVPITTDEPSRGVRALEWLRAAAVVYLLFLGMWSGPEIGASLYYPNGFLVVELLLAGVLLLLARRGRVPPAWAYPFFLPCLAALAFTAVMAGMRAAAGGRFEAMTFWILAEPMLRGGLIFLALADRPVLRRPATIALLAGVAVLAASCIVQHFTHVTRWYADLDGGWASGFAAVPLRPLRTQGITSYINLTAAILAAALPLWFLPAVRRMPLARWTRALLLLGGVATAAALWYTRSRGPAVAVAAVACLLLGSLSLWWGISAVAALALLLLVVWPGLPWWSLAAFLAALALGMLARRWRLRYLIPAVLVLGIAGGIQVVDAYLLKQPLGWRVKEEGLNDAARLQIYRQGLRTVAAAPWWGVGDNGCAASVIHAEYPQAGLLPRTQRNFHDQPLQWAAARGIPVAVVLCALVLWTVAWCARAVTRIHTPADHIVALALTGGLAIFLVCNLAEAHFWRIEGGGVFWTFAALAAVVERRW